VAVAFDGSISSYVIAFLSGNEFALPALRLPPLSSNLIYIKLFN
jgi:hypothetical protein